jgi:ABC-2 type transport system permease protein
MPTMTSSATPELRGKAFRGVFLRELHGYLITPVAWLFSVIFLLFAGAYTFYLGAFYERGQADLDPFFRFNPWL